MTKLSPLPNTDASAVSYLTTVTMRFLGSSVSPFNGERLHKRWPGRSRFVVSLDIGCTSTAISVAILNYGERLPHEFTPPLGRREEVRVN